MSSYQNTFSPKDGPDGMPDYELKPRPNLSFGVELEFALATIPPNYEDPHPDAGRQVCGVADDPDLDSERSEASPIKLGLYNYNHYQSESIDRKYVQNHVAQTLSERGLCAISTAVARFEGGGLPNNVWQVDRDLSIKYPDHNYKFLPIEVISPAFYYSQEAINEITVACETLTGRYRIAAIESGSVHVHIGNGTYGFTVSHLRKLMALLWTFEPQLDTLHPPRRTGRDRYSSPLRISAGLSDELGIDNLDATVGIDRIFKAESVNEIVDFMTSVTGGRLGFNIDNLQEKGMVYGRRMMEAAERTKKTIEFRQHEGTLDPEAVTQWIRVSVRLVEFAEEVRPEKLRVWLKQHIDTDYNVIQLLQATKQPLAAWYYEKKLAERKMLEQVQS